MSELVVRPASGADLTAISALEQAAFDQGAWSQESWAGELASADRLVIVACRPAVIGVATFTHQFETAELNRVIVSSAHRRHGVARALLDVGLAWARDVRAERMLLEVETTNASALGLYHAFGFTTISTRAGYYGPGRDAKIMEVAL